MAFTVKTEPREHRQLAVTIEVSKDQVDKELRKAAAKVASQYRIPGFRKGKAPYHVVVQQFGLNNLYSEFIDELGQKLFREAIEQEAIEPYAQSSLEDIQLEPLTYRLLVPLEPEVKLGDYRSLRVEEDSVDVDEAEVERRLASYQDEYAGWREVDRPSQFGDLLSVMVRGVIVEGDEETVVIDENDWDVILDEENPLEPAGLDREMLGMRAGEAKDFTLGWPADSQSIYAGKEAQFHVKINSVQSYEKPPLDDALAQLVSPGFNTLDDLRDSIRESLRSEEQNRAHSRYLNKVLDALVEISTVDYPPVVIEDQIDAMMRDMDQRLRQLNLGGMDELLRQTRQTAEQYREQLRPEATRIALRNLVLSEVIKQEGFEVTDDEIEAFIKRIIGADEDDEDNEFAASMEMLLHSPEGRAMVVSQLLTEKATSLLQALARGEEPPTFTRQAAETAPAEEAEAPPAADIAAEAATTSTVDPE